MIFLDFQYTFVFIFQEKIVIKNSQVIVQWIWIYKVQFNVDRKLSSYIGVPVVGF